MNSMSSNLKLTKGILLVASPEIDIGLFFRSVILLCEHSPSGSFGLILNKPLTIDIPEELVEMDSIKQANLQLRAGGPMQTNQMMLLHSSPVIPEQTLEICENVYLGGDLQFLQSAIRETTDSPILLCFGYCGWGPGFLEREFVDGIWFPFQATYRHIFEINPENLWQTVLRDMGGKYASLSMIPEDLSLN